ncbi:hypothetical protein PO78_209 [Thauera sp. SWB20]|nr:hypothetical protein PO78_209 [Thauera sp. SWB20]
MLTHPRSARSSGRPDPTAAPALPRPPRRAEAELTAARGSERAGGSAGLNAGRTVSGCGARRSATRPRKRIRPGGTSRRGPAPSPGGALRLGPTYCWPASMSSSCYCASSVAERCASSPSSRRRSPLARSSRILGAHISAAHGAGQWSAAVEGARWRDGRVRPAGCSGAGLRSISATLGGATRIRSCASGSAPRRPWRPHRRPMSGTR